MAETPLAPEVWGLNKRCSNRGKGNKEQQKDHHRDVTTNPKWAEQSTGLNSSSVLQEVKAHLCSLSCRAEPRQVPLALITQLTPSSQGTTLQRGIGAAAAIVSSSPPPCTALPPHLHLPAPAQDPAGPPQPRVPSGHRGGSSHLYLHLPLTLQQQQQQQQNQICFANELAEQLLMPQHPPRAGLCIQGPAAHGPHSPKGRFCSAQAPAQGNVHLKGWGGMVGVLFPKSLLVPPLPCLLTKHCSCKEAKPGQFLILQLKMKDIISGTVEL